MKAHDPCTHLANAHRLRDHFGEQLLYVEGIGWHVWQPPWQHEELGARRIAHGLGRIIASEAAAMAGWVAEAPNSDERERREKSMARMFRWAGTSENANTIESSLRMLQPLLAVKAEVLDADPLLLGLPNSVLDLRAGTCRQHRQADHITKTAGCDFKADATAPTWQHFINNIMNGDAELIDYLQRFLGYVLSGERGEHLLPFMIGSGANGKSTFIGTAQAMLGDYAGSGAPGLLIQRHGTEHPTSLADLQGKRLVILSETGEHGRLNEEQAKLLTGGDRITARRMRMDFYTFTPTHQLVLQSNHRPRVTGTDEGIWRRMRLLPFAVTVPPEKRDTLLPEKLRAELPGILNWCIEGWQRYRKLGFNDPAAVRLATATYRDSSDQIGEFLTECCESNSVLTVTARDLYSSYQQWCEDSGERPRTQRDFGLRLSERGFEKFRSGGIHRWRGLTDCAPCAPCAPLSGMTRVRKGLA